MSSERLQPGMWCRPSSEREWKAILELAGALGLRGVDFFGTGYDIEPRIWSSMAEKTLIYPADLSEQTSGEVPVPEFISRMYAEAEARKAPESEFGAFAPKPGEIGFSKEFIDKLEEMAKRLDALEKAFDAHLQKHGWIWQ